MIDSPAFDELHLVSDLHLGGESPFQIFGSTRELTGLIRDLATRDAERSIALVINGDFVDFLAERPSAAFDAERATAKLDRIVGDPTFAPIFEALKDFVATRKRHLVIVLGNHDLELALPWVRAHLIGLLTGGVEASAARIQLVADGTGYACRVGDARVLCIHGNEVDDWNVADYEMLRRIGRDVHFGKPIAAWTPNAGSQLVVDVMNDIKRRYPFVDLLKPEQEAVVPILLSLDPGAFNKLRAIAAIVGRKGRDALRMRTGFLDAETPDASGRAGLADVPLDTAALDANAMSGAELLQRVEAELDKGTDPMDLVRATGDRQLGFWSATWALATGQSKVEALRQALDTLDRDRSFEFGAADPTFDQIDALVSPDVDIVIAGHTHLERSLKRKRGSGCYFNSGTWARLVRLQPEVLHDPAEFERVHTLFRGGSMAALDAESGLVLKRCTVVSVRHDALPVPKTRADLRRATVDAAGAFRLVPVAGTQQTAGD